MAMAKYTKRCVTVVLTAVLTAAKASVQLLLSLSAKASTLYPVTMQIATRSGRTHTASKLILHF